MDSEKMLYGIDIIEESVLGILISNDKSIMDLIDKLYPSDFSNKTYGEVYQVMLNLYSEYSNFDINLLEIELNKRNILEKLGGREKLLEILNNAPINLDLETYVEYIKDNSIRSKIKSSCFEIASKLNDNTSDGKYILEFAQNKFFNLEDDNTKRGVISLEELGIDRKIRLDKYLNNETSIMDNKGIPTKFNDYDNITRGLHGSELLILAARPSVGKTAFALNLALNVASQSEKVVLLFSLEMGNEQLYNRILAMASEIDSRKISSETLEENDAMILSKTEERISKYKLFISGDLTVSLAGIKNQARKLKSTIGLDFIVIDYLQLISSTSANKPREQQVSEISRGLKLLSKELNVPILALAQLSRSVETRADKTPMLSDLRESGAIEQDADQVMFLHRPDYYKSEDTENNNTNTQNVELIIGKHRNGATGTINLSFNLKTQKFTNGNKEYIVKGGKI